MSGDLKASEKSVIGGCMNGNSYEKISKPNQISKEPYLILLKDGRNGLLSQTLIP